MNLTGSWKFILRATDTTNCSDFEETNPSFVNFSFFYLYIFYKCMNEKFLVHGLHIIPFLRYFHILYLLHDPQFFFLNFLSSSSSLDRQNFEWIQFFITDSYLSLSLLFFFFFNPAHPRQEDVISILKYFFRTPLSNFLARFLLFLSLVRSFTPSSLVI